MENAVFHLSFIFLLFPSLVDSTPPVVTCPGDISQTVPFGTPSRQITFAFPTATDNSGSASLVDASHQSGSLFPVGTTTVTYTFTDPTGNQNSCSFTITVTSGMFIHLLTHFYIVHEYSLIRFHRVIFPVSKLLP